MMTEESQINPNGKNWKEPDGEKLDAEIKRLWESDFKSYFKAEKDFLLQYGLKAGYDDTYIFKILAIHRVLETLAHEGGAENSRFFSQELALYFRFKQVYALHHIQKGVPPAEGFEPHGEGDGSDN